MLTITIVNAPGRLVYVVSYDPGMTTESIDKLRKVFAKLEERGGIQKDQVILGPFSKVDGFGFGDGGVSTMSHEDAEKLAAMLSGSPPPLYYGESVPTGRTTKTETKPGVTFHVSPGGTSEATYE